MNSKTALTCLVLLPALASGLCRAQTPAPTPSFTISASNVTLSSSGGVIHFTLTSVNGFVGSVSVACAPPNPPAGVKEPACAGGPTSPLIPLAANATVTGNAYLSAIVVEPEEQPGRGNLARSGTGASWTFAGVLMLGLGLCRRRLFWAEMRSGLPSGHLLLVAGLLIGLTGMSACSSGPVTLTPGVYTYTLTATPSDQSSPVPSATTMLKVTVPPGIDIEPGPDPV